MTGPPITLLHSMYMGIEKIRLLVRNLVYRVNINTDIEDAVKPAQYALDSKRSKGHSLQMSGQSVGSCWCSLAYNY